MAGETRQQLRSEQRRAAKLARKELREQSLTNVAEDSTALKSILEKYKPIVSDVAIVIAIPFAMIGMLLDNMLADGTLIVISCLTACWAVYLHHELALRLRATAMIVITIAFTLFFYILYNAHNVRDLEKNYGVLYPANIPQPLTKCNITSGYFTVFSGGGAVQALNNILSVGGLTLIAVKKRDDGSLIISTLRLFDDRGDLIARIDDGKVWVSESVRRKRPDASTIIIYDHNDDEVMSFKFLNKKSIELTGKFYTPSHQMIYLGNAYMIIGSNKFVSSCFGGYNGIAIY
ncbi:hypothetical protein [Rhodoblastus sp.]|uniref:hypothetical protein n=1 Tax=Rhodoblastus sp. TaxID=1962975 RepID=UPI003F97D808